SSDLDATGTGIRSSKRRSPSLHVRLDVNLPSSHARGPYAPNLPGIDPCIFFGGGGKTNISKEIEHCLVVSRRGLAIARQGNPMAVVGLNGQVQIQLH